MARPQKSSSAPVREGDILAAKYRVERIIGAGGMGVVVSAMHLELEQRVALKFLLPEAATNEELVGRFLREAKASVRLKGTHVAKVLDVGRMDDGRAYIVMEYLEGRDLRAELRASDELIPIEEAVSWVLQACEGLAEAHALGIVHRDLKPGNLFLTRGIDGRALVKVLDFGISKSIHPNAKEVLSLTKTEMLLGSPLYMAPEQMRSSKNVDERSDIWAVGAIAYELLTRRVPFEAETLLDLCFKVAEEGCLAVHEIRPDVPFELSDAIMRCLEKAPDARWNDIGELAFALEPFASELDVGSAARTAAILDAGTERGIPRRSDGKISARLTDSSGSRRSSFGTRSSGQGRGRHPFGRSSQNLSAASPRYVEGAGSEGLLERREITASTVAERAPIRASLDPNVVRDSSAWGTTNANELVKRGRRGVIALVGVTGALAIASVVLATSAKTPHSPVTATAPPVTATTPLVTAQPEPVDSAAPQASEPQVVASAAPVSPPPIHSDSTAMEDTSASRTSSTKPHRRGTAGTPRVKSSKSTNTSSTASKAPEPATSDGFIRERE